MISYYDSVYDKAMTQSVTESEKTKAAALVLKVFHETVCIQLQNEQCLGSNVDLSSIFLTQYVCYLMKRYDDYHPFHKGFIVFQLNCCGKGQGTTFLTHITDKLGLTDLCPSSGTYFVSSKTQQILLHKPQTL